MDIRLRSNNTSYSALYIYILIFLGIKYSSKQKSKFIYTCTHESENMFKRAKDLLIMPKIINEYIDWINLYYNKYNE